MRKMSSPQCDNFTVLTKAKLFRTRQFSTHKKKKTGEKCHFPV